MHEYFQKTVWFSTFEIEISYKKIESGTRLIFSFCTNTTRHFLNGANFSLSLSTTLPLIWCTERSIFCIECSIYILACEDEKCLCFLCEEKKNIRTTRKNNNTYQKKWENMKSRRSELFAELWLLKKRNKYWNGKTTPTFSSFLKSL